MIDYFCLKLDAGSFKETFVTLQYDEKIGSYNRAQNCARSLWIPETHLSHDVQAFA